MIQTRGLTKDFVVSSTETVHAVRGIDLDIAPGELVAVLGPNGAGKSTTMRMLTTLIRPTSGSATVAGVDVVADPATGPAAHRLRRAGQRRRAPAARRRRADDAGRRSTGSTVRRRGGAPASCSTRSTSPRWRRRKVSDLSGGQRRRLDVALGLVHAPRLLFLDEPSTGLDPHNRANLWEHISRLRAEHDMTIVLTTHYLDEADTMAERVVVVDHGQVIADDTADGLKRDARRRPRGAHGRGRRDARRAWRRSSGRCPVRGT